jgi:hypothetical protein
MSRLIFVIGSMWAGTRLDADKFAKWSVFNPEAGTCLSMDHPDAAAGIGVGVVDKQFMLLVWAPELPTPPGDHDGVLSFDGKPDIPIDAYGKNDQLIISFERGPQADAITHSDHITVTAGGHSHRYDLTGFTTAADEVARCAGVPPLNSGPN